MILLSPSPNYAPIRSFPHTKRRPIACSALRIEDIVTDFAHNKVLVAAGLAGAIGQLSKPFTGVLNGKDFDIRSVIGSGGMPSTHSAGVAAAATSLGLERGFSDSIFGMSVVFAVLVMYDAQGVRREVGKHAKVLNKTLSSDNEKNIMLEDDDRQDSGPQTSSLNSLETSLLSISKKSTEVFQKKKFHHNPLSESVGHTELQVIVGALWGFVVAIGVDFIL